MIAYGYPELALVTELDLAERIHASVLEILPDWRRLPDPQILRRVVADRGLSIHSAHGCWGGQAIKADRVDLGNMDELTHRESLDDLRRCVDWLDQAGGRFLVVHPGGLSSSADVIPRRESLARGLTRLAEHAEGSRVTICVENMPPGVFPGSQMSELFELLQEIDHPRLGLALDTGHAHMSASLACQTQAAGRLLRTTHVHDNDGRRDTHDPPGRGTIDWRAWGSELDRVGYGGPIMLECIRQLRSEPQALDRALLAPLLGSPGRPDSVNRTGCDG